MESIIPFDQDGFNLKQRMVFILNDLTGNQPQGNTSKLPSAIHKSIAAVSFIVKDLYIARSVYACLLRQITLYVLG